MPRGEYETEDEWDRRGPFYAIFKRIEHHRDYFEAVWKLQPRFMAVFGRETEAIFAELHSARRRVEVAAHMLSHTKQRPYEDQLERELQTDIWGHPEKDDRVGSKLDAFRSQIETLCFPHS
jgi:hypothetical protein